MLAIPDLEIRCPSSLSPSLPIFSSCVTCDMSETSLPPSFYHVGLLTLVFASGHQLWLCLSAAPGLLVCLASRTCVAPASSTKRREEGGTLLNPEPFSVAPSPSPCGPRTAHSETLWPLTLSPGTLCSALPAPSPPCPRRFLLATPPFPAAPSSQGSALAFPQNLGPQCLLSTWFPAPRNF